MDFLIDFGIGAVLAAWFLVSAVSLYGIIEFRRSRLEQTARRPTLPDPPPAAAVILPAKGSSPGLARVLLRYARQAYPTYRLLVAVESETDPAYRVARAVAAKQAGRVEVVVAGLARRGAQKVHNQLAALARLTSEDAVVCFADADTRPARDWLSTLVAWTLEDPRHRLTSGYRWLMPSDSGLAPLIAAAGNGSVATAARKRSWNLAWGGAMALHRDLLDRLDLPAAWRAAVTDDLTLTQVVRANGGYVESIRDLLVPSGVAFDLYQLLAFGRRQYQIVRACTPRHWALAAFVTTASSLGWLTAAVLIASGAGWAAGLAAIVYGFDAARGVLRWRVGRTKWPGRRGHPLDRTLWVDALATPLVMAVHATCVWSSLAGRRMRWAGVTYAVDGPNDVTVVSR